MNEVPSAASSPQFNKVVVSHGEAEVRVLCGKEYELFRECSAVFCGDNFLRLRMNVGVENGQNFTQRTKWFREGRICAEVRYVNPEDGSIVHRIKYGGLKLESETCHSSAGPAVVQAEFAFKNDKHFGDIPPWPQTSVALRPLVSAVDNVAETLERLAKQKSNALYAARGTSHLPSRWDLKEPEPEDLTNHDYKFLLALPSAVQSSDATRKERNIIHGEAFLNRILSSLACSILSAEQTAEEDIVVIQLRRLK